MQKLLPHALKALMVSSFIILIGLKGTGQPLDSLNNSKDSIVNASVVSDSLNFINQSATKDSVISTPGFPIVFLNDTILFLYQGNGLVTAEERANHVSETLNEIHIEVGFVDSLISLTEIDGELVLLYKKDQQLIAFNHFDAEYKNTSMNSLANEFRGNIGLAMENHIEEKSFYEKLYSWLWIGVVVLLLYFVIRIINRFFKKLAQIVPKKLEQKINGGINIKKVEIISAERVKTFITLLVKWVRIIFLILMIYVAIMIMVQLFPGTKKITDQILDYLLTPLKSFYGVVLEYIPKFFNIFIIVMITKYILRFVKFIFSEIEKGKLEMKGFYNDWAEPTYKIVRFLIYMISAVMIFPFLPGADSPAFKGISIFLGVLFSLGSSSAISNLVGGLVITYMRPFKMGDRINLLDTEGYVIDKNMLVTKIRTIKNEEITIPNSLVLNSHIKNYHANHIEANLILYKTITIGYDVPGRKVEEMLLKASKGTKDVLQDPEPFVYQLSLDDNYVSYQINLYIDDVNKMDQIYSDLNQSIRDEFDKEGVEIMSPSYSAIRDGNDTTISNDKIPTNYQRPLFKIGLIDKLFK